MTRLKGQLDTSVTRLEQIKVNRLVRIASRGYTENRVTTRHRYENASHRWQGDDGEQD